MSAQQLTTPSPDEETVILLMQVPRTNDKKELAAEQMFASLHGLLMFPPEKWYKAAKHVSISFEIAVINKRIGFYVCVPKYLKGFIEEQIYAQYPTVQISQAEDFTMPKPNMTTAGTELKLIANDSLPIKTFQSFEVDPLAAITATLAKFEENEEAWIQLVIKPADQSWHKKSERYIAGLRGSGGGGISSATSMTGVMSALWTPPEATKTESAGKLAEHEQTKARSAEEKNHKLSFACSVRIAYRGFGVSAPEAMLKIQSIIAGYKQFNSTYLNGFDQTKIITNESVLDAYRNRSLAKKPLMLNIEEIASLYHLPHTSVETPYILWASAQTSEPPANLPIVKSGTSQPDISPIAGATFRGLNTPFGLPRSDRGRHLYILGQTGVGKSALLELLTISDIGSPYGFAVIDPHGDYATSILARIPAERAGDVIYFNPSDTEYPIAFNPMEVTDPKLKTQTASELIGVLKRMFDSWGPRLEYILRYSILALLEYPNSTMLDITRILTDKKFRSEVLKHVTDPIVNNFWTVEFASWNDKFAAEAVAPVLNKVGAFTANPVIRNIIGQPKSSFNIRQIMDERKILIVNLSRGLVGEDNAAILGALMVTKIQLAAMSRADILTADRVPFYLYVDEFQNFATDSFATILSEARKYALNLTVANQYVAQMSPEVKDAVFGNVGSMISFRMGADDARSMQRYFEPKFTEYDLVHMHNRHFVINMTIEGEKSPAFSATTINLPPIISNQSELIIGQSRQQYALDRAQVEAYVNEHYMPPSELKKHTDKIAKDARAKAPKPAESAQVAEEPKPATPKPAGPPPEPTSPEMAPEVKPERTPKTNSHGLAGLAVKLFGQGEEETEAPKKRKRKRTRKRKNKSSGTEVTPTSVVKPEEITPPKVKTPAKKSTKSAQETPKIPAKTTPKKQPNNKKQSEDSDDDEVVIFSR